MLYPIELRAQAHTTTSINDFGNDHQCSPERVFNHGRFRCHLIDSAWLQYCTAVTTFSRVNYFQAKVVTEFAFSETEAARPANRNSIVLA